MFQNFGIWQVLLILLVVLILFGVGRLPEVGRGLGKAIREFRATAAADDLGDKQEKSKDTSTESDKTDTKAD